MTMFSNFLPKIWTNQIRNFFTNFSIILNSKTKRHIRFAVILIIAEAFVEAAFVALVFPIVLLSTQTGSVGGRIGAMLAQFSVQSRSQQFVACGLALLFISIIRLVVRTQSQLLREQISFTVRSDLASRLFECYLAMPFKQILKSDTARLVSTITTESVVVSGLVFEMLSMVAGIISVSMMLILMIAIDPGLTLIAIFICSLIAVLSYASLHRRKKVLGEIMREKRQNLASIAAQALACFREVVVYGQQWDFVQRFNSNSRQMNDAFYQGAIYKIVPRSIVECGFVALIAIFMIFVGIGSAIDVGLMARFTAIAIVSLRLLPIIAQLATQASQLSFHEASLIEVIKIVTAQPETVISNNIENIQQPSGALKSLSFNRVTYTYANANNAALREFSVEIPVGSLIGIFGPSGSGKSTFIGCLLGFLNPETGSVVCNGESINQDLHGWRSRIGYVPQEPYILNDSIKVNIVFGRLRKDEEQRLHQVIEQVKLGDVLAALPFGLETQLGERGMALSGGQRQRLALARALYAEPQLLVLDEATSALDSEIAEAVDFAIASLKGSMTVLVVAHRISTMQRCDIVMVMKNGTLEALDAPELLMKKSETFIRLATVERKTIQIDETRLRTR